MITWHWLAGFFEGEGHIQWIEAKKGTSQGTGSRLVLGQKDKRPLEAIRDFLLEQGVKNPIMYYRVPKVITKNHVPIWTLNILRQEDVLFVLENIKVGLFQKREKADFVIGRIKERLKRREIDFERAMKLRETGLPWFKVAREMKVGWARLKNVLTSNGVKVGHEKTNRDEYERKMISVKKGHCFNCGKKRGKTGTATRCRICADKANKGKRDRRALKRIS